MDRTTSAEGAAAALALLSDDELIERVKVLVGDERRASAALVRSLVELDTRRLYLREGCSSLFTYCTQVLHLSEGSAYNRIETARAARRFPTVLKALENGDLTLTAVRLLAPHLTPANHAEVLTAARHKSKEEIQDLISSLNPRSSIDTVIRLHVTLTRDTYAKLRRAQALARHALPDGDLGSILDRALTLLIDDMERRRFGRVASPRPARGDQRKGRRIPAAVRRAVVERDEARCAFVGRTGRCRETGFLEFHHVEPYAMGGMATADNIQLRCRAHNQHEARVFFADGPPEGCQQEPVFESGPP
jgi:hypothetical protein